MLKKLLTTSLIATSLVTISNNTYAASNNDSGDDVFTANDSTEPSTPTNYDFPQDKAIPIGEEPPFIIVPNDKANTKINHDTQVHSAKTVTPSNQTNINISSTPQPSHARLTVLPNTGGVHSLSPFAIYSLLLLGGTLIVYRPFASISKSKV
ncbi:MULTISPECIES: hypothetical protein [unclassified Staphylococcus]|uniref:hypothetical protein n=1 Tax=unclassified Staphylococcus TaxID=91994 RepID=UPI0021CE15E8|nr:MULTISPECIES: hypothetical protein [unclassified Staphylococcus]UXR78111.1 hypothetical protein MUA92_09815 [Staphylococcus sp. IVB6227]UXR82274.1 hypothetical protein MUA51_09525 [Staphylococcus sp. IVB6214]